MTKKKKEILALILARGGSKGVPRKNLINVLGKPLIAWTIEVAKASKYISKIIVSTDDPEIANVAKSYGADVPFMRPEKLAQDDSLDIEAFEHAITCLRDEHNYSCDLIVHLRPTGPARNPDLIDAALDLMLRNPLADSLRSVSLAEQTPFKMWFIEKDGFMKPVIRLKNNRESHSSSRQSLPKAYWQNGYIDVVRPTVILDKKSMVGDVTIPFIINFPVYDIDYPEDVSKVEVALRKLINKEETDSNEVGPDRFPG